MKRLLLLLAVITTGCASTYQSAHTLAPNKMQVTADITGAKAFDSNDTTNTVVAGDVMVRHGLDEGLDGGIRLSRLPSDTGTDTDSMFTVDLKKRISDSETSTVSIDIPLGVIWEENRSDLSNGIIAFTPTLLLGIALDPTTELVFGPKFALFINPEESNDKTLIGGGASIGIRFSDTERSYGLQPELSLLKVEDTDGAILTFGIAVAAGN
ncbi:MAG TPA: hypothetical protein VL326_19915 [Kofleriaceae bacterium]|nr:hypothetical protein [Kofleriaceae bacterium]